MTLLETARRAVLFQFWQVVIAWRLTRGRYFIFRDVPTWVVRWFAESENGDSEAAKEAAVQAQDELRARLRTKRWGAYFGG